MADAQVPAKTPTKMEVAEQWAKDAKAAFLSVIGGPDAEQIWNREVMFAIQAIRKNPVIAQTNPISIRTAVANVAMTGITLNPALQLAYLIPRDGECCLDFSFRGLIRVLTNSGSVKAIDAHVVYDFDEFDYELGGDPHIHYKPTMTPPADFDGKPESFWRHLVCVATIATLHDGTKSYCILPKWKIERTAKTSKAFENTKMPWQTFTDEQARKTGIKYHYKTLPQTERASEAVRILNEHEGLDLDAKGENTQELGKRIAALQGQPITQGDVVAQGKAIDIFPVPGAPNEIIGVVSVSGSPKDPAAPCVCEDMVREFYEWDCPNHGRMRKVQNDAE